MQYQMQNSIKDHFFEYFYCVMERLKFLLNEDNIRLAWMGLSLVFCVSLLYSLFLISLTLIIMSALVVLSKIINPASAAVKWLPVIYMILSILPFLMGFFTSSDTFLTLKLTQLNATYLFIPITIVLMPELKWKDLLLIISFFMLVMTFSTFGVLWNYFENFNSITQSIGSGKAIPTPIDHVRYSILLSIACVWSFISFLKNEPVFNLRDRRISFVLFTYLFIILHILAVRSGVGLSYLGIMVVGSLVLLTKRKFYLTILLWIMVFLIPIVAYLVIPSFKNKIDYSRYDISLMLKGKGANYSDSERLRSIELGIEIWKDHPLLGVGTGDLKHEIDKRYQEKYFDNGQPKYPHNQIVKIASSSGLIGLFLFIAGIYLPFLLHRNYLHPYTLALITMLSVSFMVEATLERSYSLAFYCFFAALLYRFENKSLPLKKVTEKITG